MALTRLTQLTGQSGISTTIDYTMSDLVVDTISVGGTITYNDVTSVDSIGIITARKGIQVLDDGLNVVGVSTFSNDLHLNQKLVISDTIRHSGDANTKIRFPADDTFAVETAGSERLRIDSSGKLLVGHTGRMSGDVNAQLQVEGTSYNTASATFISNAGASSGNQPHITLAKTRGSSDGSNTILADGDSVGIIQWAGADGTDLNSVAASVRAIVNGAVGVNSTPGAMIFGTTAAGAASPTERLRITSSGAVMINTTNSSSRTLNLKGTFGILSASQTGVIDMSITDAGEASIAPYVAGGSALVLKTNASGQGVAERLRIDSAGSMGLGTNNPRHKLQVAGDVVLTYQTGNTITNGLFLDPGDTGAGNRPDIVLKGAGTGALSIKAFQVYYDNGGTESFNIDYEGNVFSGKSITVAEKLIHHGDTDTFLEFGTDTISFDTGGSERLRISNSEVSAVGIVMKANTGFVSDTNLIFNSDNNANNSTNDSIIFKNAGTERVRIKGTGYTGIGTAFPQEKLHLYGGNCALEVDAPANRYCSVGFSVDGASKWWMGRGDSDILSETSFFIGKDAGNATDKGGNSAKLIIDANGNIGVNVAPKTSGTLFNTVDHFIAIGDNDTGIAQDGDGQFEIWTNDQEIANFNTGQVTLKKVTQINNRLGIGILPSTTNNAFGNRTYKIAIGDSDTGFAQISDGVLGWYSNAVERLRITTTGLMGLGTGSPSDALEISHASDPAIRLHYGGNSGYSVISIDNANNLTLDVDVPSAGSNSFFNVKIDGSEKFRINSSGSVGINTTLTHQSSGNPMLNIAAATQAFSGSTNLADGGGLMFQPTDTLPSTGRSYPGIFWSGNTASLDRMRAGIIGVTASNHDATDLVFLTRYAADGTALTPADEAMRIKSSGRIGIGSDNPNRIMTIVDGPGGGIGVVGTNAGIYLGTHHTGGFQNNAAIARAAANNYHITNSTPGDLCIASESEADILIGTSVSAGAMDERIRIKHNGRIGINQASPNDYEVDIRKRSGATDAQIRLHNPDTGSSNDTVMRYSIAGTSASNYIYFGDGDDANAGQIRYSHSTNTLSFKTAGEERFHIKGNEFRFIGGDQNSNEGSKTTKIVYRTLAAAVWSTVEIGNLNGSNGACSFRMTINCPNSGWSITKIYDIASAYNFTTNNWRVVKPITSTYQYDGDDFEVNIKVNTSTTYLRLRKNRTTNNRTGTLQVIMEIYGKGETFSGTSATGSDSGQLEQYEGTPIGAYSDTSANVGAQMDYNGVQRVKTYNSGALISDDIGSLTHQPSQFPANNVQLMVYTSTNGQPIDNNNCARILIATDAKQTGAQGYHGALDFGSSDATAASGSAEFQWRTASIMCRGDGDTSPAIGDGDLQFWTKQASGSLTHRFDIAPNGDLTGTDQSIGSLSDQRLKTNIQDFTYDIDKFKKLRTRTFDWKHPEQHQVGTIRGFVAQEIDTADDYWNYQWNVPKDNIDYQHLTDGGEDYNIIDHRPAKASKLGAKDAMYVSVIQQLLSKIETLEEQVSNHLKYH